MKCPKCEYLGFETGDRCKNCGYDFSLALADATRTPDLPLQSAVAERDSGGRVSHVLEDRLHLSPSFPAPAIDRLAAMPLDAASPQPATRPAPAPSQQPGVAVAADASTHVGTRRTSGSAAPPLPLFTAGSGDTDEPLIKLPSSPRPPLAVRRTPERPRLRTVPKPSRRGDPGTEADPVLTFSEESTTSLGAHPVRPARARAVRPESPAQLISGPSRRLLAACTDLAILLSVDAVVVYFTFQIAGVPLSVWPAMPLLPLLLFLGLVKVAYFSVFTALGGQTVGKMAMGIRVVAEDDRDVQPSQAVQRTLAAVASVATIGIGFAPVLLGGDRRALHDRVAGTRVVGPRRE